MKYNLKPIDDLANENWEEGSEVGNIVREIRETAFRLRTEDEVRLFIQNHQLALHQRKSTSTVAESCDKVLYFLETYFWKFLHGSSLISNLGKEALYVQWEEEIKKSEELIAAILSERLQHIVNVHLNPRNVHCTVNRCNYLRRFWVSWSIDFVQFYEEHNEESLMTFLVSQNFNSPIFFKYLTGHITSKLDKAEDLLLKKQVIEGYVKRYSAISKRIGQEYTPNFPPIYELVENWLQLELKHSKKREKTAEASLIEMTGTSIQKIETSLSVAQLACLLKMLYQAGVITNPVQMEMLEIATKMFRTKKTENIALESLHNKYYNVEDKTKETISDILKGLIKPQSSP